MRDRTAMWLAEIPSDRKLQLLSTRTDPSVIRTFCGVGITARPCSHRGVTAASPHHPAVTTALSIPTLATIHKPRTEEEPWRRNMESTLSCGFIVCPVCLRDLASVFVRDRSI